jgi:predicted nucleotidyltransferase
MAANIRQPTTQGMPPRFIPRSRHGEVLAAHRDAVISLAHEHGMANVRVFGSTVRGTDRPDSDIDLLIDVGPTTGLFDIGRLEFALSQLLGLPVDLIPASSLKPRLANEVLTSAVPL